MFLCSVLVVIDAGPTADDVMALTTLMKRRRYLEEKRVDADPAAAALPPGSVPPPFVVVSYERFFVDFRNAAITAFISEKVSAASLALLSSAGSVLTA